MVMKRSRGEEFYYDPAEWTNSEEKILIHLMLKKIEKGNKPSATFNKRGWRNIEHGFREKTNKCHSFAQFRNKVNQMRVRHFDLLALLKEPGFSWDPVMGQVIATDSAWDSAIKANKKARRFSKKTYPLFNELGVIYGCELKKSNCVCQLAQNSPNAEVKHNLVDESSDDTPSEPIRVSSDEEKSPSRNVGQLLQQLPSLTNEINGTMAGKALNESFGIAFPSRTSDEKVAEVAYTKTRVSPDHVLENLESSPFSITNCVKCLDSIEGVGATTYVKALKMFKDVDWREMFMAMSAERRLNWLASLE